MHSRHVFSALLRPLGVGLLVAAAACLRGTTRSEQVVLEVGDRPVSLGEFDRFVQASVQQESPVLSSEVMSALFDQFIEEQLLLRAADAAGIQADPRAVEQRMKALHEVKPGMAAPPDAEADADNRVSTRGVGDAGASYRPDDATTAHSIERQLRIEKVIETQALAGIEVPEEEIAAYYEAHRDDFVRPETVDVSQILVDDEAAANDLRKSLVAKQATFEDAARERSQGPEAANGGRMGTFARGELPPSFEAQVFQLKPGTLSEVVSTDFGFHIFRVNARTERQELGLDEVREAIRVDLMRSKGDEAMKRYVAELSKRYPVKVHHEYLTFAVADRYGDARGGHTARMEKSR